MPRRLLYTFVLIMLLVACAPQPTVSEMTQPLPTAMFPPPTPDIATPLPGSEDMPVVAPVADSTAQPTNRINLAAPTATPVAEATLPDPQPEAESGDLALNSAADLLVSAAPGVPAAIVEGARQTVAASNGRYGWTDDPDAADLLVQVNGGQELATWIYALAVPFATIPDGTSWDTVQQGWRDGASDLGSGLLAPEAAATWTAVWGQPSPVATTGGDLMGELWAIRPAWTILPFEQLRPEFKVLAIDNQSPLDRTFDVASYPLKVTFGIMGSAEDAAEFASAWAGPTTNRDPARLTTVAMTGVTALVRATAYQMEQRGILWPGEEVAPVLQEADIAHISNEVAFMPDCPFPDPYGGTTFCSDERYFELLKHLGTDVIELTGNHVNDYGRDKLAYSLDLYEQAGMVWFGGGRNLADAAKATVFDHNGNRIAFVGCNPVGPANAWATADAAGSRPCGPDMAAQITQLRNEGHVVIATLQYNEYYQYPPGSQQAADFAALAEAGAAAVSGSQAHHAQSFAFDNGSFIHFGPGNLFFDQMDMMGTRQTFVDTYHIYDGRLLSVELWTGLIENWARPRLMTTEERADLLRATFEASGW